MGDGFTGKVEHGVKMLIMVLWSVIMLGLFFVCIIETVDLVGDMDVSFNSDSPVINILCILVFMLIAAAITLMVKRFIPDRVINSIRKNRNIIGIIITAAVGIFLVWWISITHYEPVSDQILCFEMARQFIDGNYSNWSTGYMSVYPFQNGIVMFDVMLLGMFGDSAYIAFQYVNVAFFINAVVSMYVISRYIFKENSSIWTWLVTVTFYPFAMYVVFCYGTMTGFSLAMTAAMFMFIYFDRRKLVYMIPCGIAMTLSLIMKSNYAIVLVGIALYLLFDSVMTKKLKSTIGLVIVLAIYIAGSRSFNIAVEKLTDTPLAQGIPKIAWVAMGMNESVNTPGWFDNYNGYVYEKNNRDQDATVAEAISHIKQRGKAILTTNPLRFYYKKITSQWNNPTWECFDMQERESHTPDYAIKAAAAQNYLDFYKEEEAYRGLMKYPPEWNMMVVLMVCSDETFLDQMAEDICSNIRSCSENDRDMRIIGPSAPVIAKIRDIYRRVVYIKNYRYNELVALKDQIEIYVSEKKELQDFSLQFDFNPLNMY